MMRAEWSIVEAKSKLSEVLNRAEREAQFINRRNRQYVVIDGDEYQRLIGNLPSLKDLLLRGPGLDGVEVIRDKSVSREIEL